MATAAARLMLLENGKPFPLLLLRGPAAACLSRNLNTESQIISEPKLQSPFPFLNFAVGVGSFESTVSACNVIKPLIDWRSVASGEMDRLDVSGIKRIKSDVDFDDHDDDDPDDDDLDDDDLDNEDIDDEFAGWDDSSSDEDKYDGDDDRKRRPK